jgi:hypothetical protein
MIRHPLPQWIVVGIFLTAVAAVPLACQIRTGPATPPTTTTEMRTLTELAQLLSQAAPEWRVVPTAKYGSLGVTMYLCKDSRSWKELSWIRHDSKHTDKWQGVVYCERVGNIISFPETEIQMWGEHAMQIEPFVFFGDAEMLRRIDKVIRNHSNTFEN